MTTGIEVTQAVAIRPEPVAHSAGSGRVYAGYTLQERLGVGGYGEVWRAVGPGGLHKAVKILHGFQDGPQAELELKSLQRMRDLRHPFLLNIERIEVADGRLIIVTELAEGNLETRFEELCQEGRPGIPRDELLGYLRDAADALDFMYEQHGLQHLDIKPANLLIQGGRVKVADFGLTKDVCQTQASIVGGFTPRFAPPELFEGRPSRSSDQYSLAIVYQLLVTGTPPFAGRTTAQLAVQHLNSPPDLSPLTPAERPIVGRALSKNPQARFPGCRAFVDQLSARSSRNRPEFNAAAPPKPAHSDSPPNSLEKGGRPGRRSTPLGAIPLNGEPPRYSPTVIVGLGGLGGAVLCALRRRLLLQFGSVPAIQFLYIDTDPRAVTALSTGDSLGNPESACIELRRPDEYRRAASNRLNWISRRWLFNIPRSGQVQGMRPLGRLAFVDHQHEIRKRMRRSLAQATSAEALEASRAATGLPFEPLPPDIVVVGAVCGGTGGGAVLDAAYMLRQQLLELGLEDGKLLGVLMHATSADSEAGTVQRANALATLRELKHFHSALGYPGDAASQLAGSTRTPFDHVYFVHLGDGLSNDGFERGIENVSAYLYRGSLTPARRFLEACRATDDPAEAQGRGTFLRSFGICGLGGSGRLSSDTASNQLCRSVLRELWSGSAAASGLNSRDWADAFLKELELRSEQVQMRAAGLLHGELGQQLDRLLRGRLAILSGGGYATLTAARAMVDSILEDRRGGDTAMGDLVGEKLATVVRKSFTAIRQRTLKDSFAAKLGLSGAVDLTRGLLLRVDALASDMASFVASLHQEQTRFAERCQTGHHATAPPSPGAGAAFSVPQPGPVLYEFGMLAICTCVHEAAAESIRELRTALTEWEQTLSLAKQRVRSLEELFGGATGEPLQHGPDAAQAAETHSRPAAFQQLHETAVSLLGAMNPDRLVEFVRTPAEALELLAVRISRRAAGLAMGSDAPDAAHGLAAAGSRSADAVWPFLTNAGGGHRVLAVTPMAAVADDWRRQLAHDFGPCVTVEVNAEMEPYLCCELQQLDCRQVELCLTDGDDRIAEMASRLHTRADIKWQEG